MKMTTKLFGPNENEIKKEKSKVDKISATKIDVVEPTKCWFEYYNETKRGKKRREV